MQNKRMNLFKYIVVVQIASIILYFLGPITWRTKNVVFVFGLVTAYLLFLTFGYRYGDKRYIKKKSYGIGTIEFYLRAYSVFALITCASKLMILQRIVTNRGWSNIANLYAQIITGNFGLMYRADVLSSSGAAMYGGTFLSLLDGFLAPIVEVFIPITIVCFSKLKLYQKLLGVVTFAVISFASIASGTSAGFFVIILYFMIGFLLRTGINGKEKRKKNWKTAILIILAAVIVLYTFNIVMASRNGTFTDFSQLGENYIDTSNSILYQIMPNSLKILLIWVDFYYCAGYYGMSLATTMDWHPMFGAGFSRWFCEDMNHIFGCYKYLYSYRIEEFGYSWGDTQCWHTAYTWFANDLSFFGVILLMFAIGMLFVYVYRDAMDTLNPLSIGLLLLLTEMLIFLPCNNIVFAKASTFIAFFFYLFAWLIMRKWRVRLR